METGRRPRQARDVSDDRSIFADPLPDSAMPLLHEAGDVALELHTVLGGRDHHGGRAIVRTVRTGSRYSSC